MKLKLQTAQSWMARHKLALAAGALAVSIVLRIVWRGDYLLGWELIGPAHGSYLIHTYGWWKALKDVFWLSRHYGYWATTGSIFYGYLPGAWNTVLPSQHYGTVISICLMAAAFFLVFRFTRTKRADLWVLPLALAASPTLLAYTVMGWPYGTTIVPAAIALLMVFDDRIRGNPLLTLVLGLIAVECSWHLYELAIPFVAIFGIAALLIPNTPKLTRAIWLGFVGLQVGMMRAFPSHRAYYTNELLNRLTPTDLLDATWLILKRTFVEWHNTIPLMLALGIASLFLIRRHRLFWVSVLLSQMLPLYLMALRGEQRPRRFNVIEFLGVAFVMLGYAELKAKRAKGETARAERRRRALVPAFVSVLVLGVALQLTHAVWYFSQPQKEDFQPLPYTTAPDLKVQRARVAFAERIAQEVYAGRKVILNYNLSSRPEWLTDPSSILERIYLKVGHVRFTNQVFVFGEQYCRYVCLPIRQATDIDEFTKGLSEGRYGHLAWFRFASLEDFPPRDKAEGLEQAMNRYFTFSDVYREERAVIRTLEVNPAAVVTRSDVKNPAGSAEK